MCTNGQFLKLVYTSSYDSLASSKCTVHYNVQWGQIQTQPRPNNETGSRWKLTMYSKNSYIGLPFQWELLRM